MASETTWESTASETAWSQHWDRPSLPGIPALREERQQRAGSGSAFLFGGKMDELPYHAVLLAIDSQAVSLAIDSRISGPPFVKNRFFYRKINFFIVKKIS